MVSSRYSNSLHWDYVLTLQPGILSTADQDGHIESATFPTLAPRTYLVLYQQFADALDGSTVVPVKPELAADVIRIIELVNESAAVEKTMYVS
jgi:hypothetical protein